MVTLNFLNLLITSLILILCLTLVLGLSDLHNLNSYQVDFFSRSYTNDFFTNTYYILWTNFSYLYIFVFTYLFIIMVSCSRLGSDKSLVVVTTVLLSLLVISNLTYWHLNVYLSTVNIYGSNSNKLLTNSINKYHPFLFYVGSLNVLLYFLGLKRVFFNKSNFHLTTLILSIRKSSLWLILLFFTLFLGAWWALQEGSWGGWWNWDPSEVFGLVITYSYLYVIHTPKSLNRLYWLLNSLKALSLFYLSVYFLIQLNFGLVSHNFGTRIDWFANSDHTYLLLLTLMSLFLLKTCLFLTKQFKNSLLIFNNLNRKNMKLYSYGSSGTDFRFLLYGLIYLQSSLAFIYIINDLLWKIFLINMFNNFQLFSIKLTIIYILAFFSLKLFNLGHFHLLLFSYMYFFYDISILIVLPLVSLRLLINYSTVTHLLILFTLSNSYNSEMYSFLTYNTLSLLDSIGWYSLNINSVENSTLFSSAGVIVESLFNFFSTSDTTTSIQSFSCLAQNGISTQGLFSNTDAFRFFINMFDYSAVTINLLFSISILFTVFYLRNPQLIIF